ncbi:hypothetical protein BH23GEM9_BH23GEM9_24780 [soil metagenome]
MSGRRRNEGLLLERSTSIAGPAVPARDGRTVPMSDAAEWLARLSLRQKVAQIVMPRIGGEYMPAGSADFERYRHWVSDLEVGGVIVSMGPPLEIAAKLNTLQGLAPLPLLVSADMESGPGRVLTGGVILPYGLENGGGTQFPPLMALGATADTGTAYELGRITALEGRAVGIHVAFAPVVDVNSNPRNPIINTRSYGADPELVARMAAAHVRGLQDHGMLATAKHFPGHGDTATDSHLELASTTATADAMRRVHLTPFRAVIEAGIACIMSGHIATPSLTGDSVPATLSPELIDTLLRSEMGFAGLVFTDALDMGAITKDHGAAGAGLLALRAGVGVLLQPPAADVAAVISGVVEAVEQGILAEERVDSAVRRVLAAKQRLGLFEDARVSLDRVPEVVGIPAHVDSAVDAASRAITVLRNADALLPLASRSALCAVFTEEHDPLMGRHFIDELTPCMPRLETLTLDAAAGPATLAARLEQFAAAAELVEIVIFAPFTRVAPGIDAAALNADVVACVEDISRRRWVAIVSFGNPYIFERFPLAACHVAAWSGSQTMQRAAARALAGRTAVRGTLPIPVPPLYESGAGMQLDPARRP